MERVEVTQPLDVPSTEEDIPEDFFDKPENVIIMSSYPIEISGVKWILGLGSDSMMYNWNVDQAVWRLFKIEPEA